MITIGDELQLRCRCHIGGHQPSPLPTQAPTNEHTRGRREECCTSLQSCRTLCVVIPPVPVPITARPHWKPPSPSSPMADKSPADPTKSAVHPPAHLPSASSHLRALSDGENPRLQSTEITAAARPRLDAWRAALAARCTRLRRATCARNSPSRSVRPAVAATTEQLRPNGTAALERWKGRTQRRRRRSVITDSRSGRNGAGGGDSQGTRLATTCGRRSADPAATRCVSRTKTGPTGLPSPRRHRRHRPSNRLVSNYGRGGAIPGRPI